MGPVLPFLSSSNNQWEQIDLSGNSLSGEIPAALGNLSSLTFLSLSNNVLAGGIPFTLGNLSLLQYLNLSNNMLSGEIPYELSNCNSLRVLVIEDNKLSASLPSALKSLSQLRVLSFAGNLIEGSIPVELGSISSLQSVDLSRNNLSGPLSDFYSGWTDIRSLSLSSNSFSGTISSQLVELTNLEILNLAENDLSGVIPPFLGSFPSLRVLNLTGNRFTGGLPSSLGKLLTLQVLELRAQNLSGAIPLELAGLPNLQVLALAGNALIGTIPSAFGSLSTVQVIDLQGNKLVSSIPSSMGMLKRLRVLSLSDNYLSGNIPGDLGSCSNLMVFEARSNSLNGSIPTKIGDLKKLEKLDLGVNNLTGSIPSELYNCSALVILDLDANYLTGPISSNIGQLNHLEELILADNALNGSIPYEIGDLLQLRNLDLSSNNLTGSIPLSLGGIDSLRQLNLSENNLQGAIPRELGSRFSKSSFAGNSLLCGAPLNVSCPKNAGGGLGKHAIVSIIVVASVLSGTIFVFLIICTIVHFGPDKGSGGTSIVQSEQKIVMFYSPITYAHVLEATGQFDEEHVLSRTRYGIIFKACLQDGTVFSIRKLPEGGLEESMFHREAEMLGRVKHRNLAVLRGYYVSGDVKLLVYDYMPNGNLAALLQEAAQQGGHVLNWPMRHLIALGVARGLSFLHSQCNPPIVHGDVTPNNVYFDADFEAHLSDFGLERLSPMAAGDPPSSSTAPPVGSVGYVSPEVSLSGQPSRESDVYSFGIVLLELLTGQRPMMFSEEDSIVKWVKRQLQTGQMDELFEASLLEQDVESSEWEELLLAVKVALLCTAPDPIDRPSMTEVVFMLEGCRTVEDQHPSSSDPTSQTSPSQAECSLEGRSVAS
ncbi:hypothetical protein KP509_18G032000 [Ceratopteris richardii]|nr:hypothetical protein KP509_18G032000 [Ceratopteris richardii]